jgi:hypothetical protein
VKAGVVAEFDPRKSFNPIFWVVASEAPQIHLESAVHNFRLTIRLGVVGRAKVELGAVELEKCLPKSTRKSRVPVTNDGGRHTMKTKKMLVKKICATCGAV